MMEAERPQNEAERLAALEDYDILDTGPEQAFDDLTRIAAEVCGTPIALVSLVAQHRQWFKSRQGLSATETEREVAFCSHAILKPDEVFLVPDAKADPRFRDNPLVVGEPQIRAYFGAPLVTSDGYALGTLCVIDHKPVSLTPRQIELLRALARQVMSQMELRQKCSDLAHLADELSEVNDEVSRKNDEISRFYHTLAHELKTPLTASREFISILSDGLLGPLNHEQGHHLGIVTECLDQIKVYMNDLLDMTRLDTGKLGLVQKRETLSGLIQRAVSARAVEADERGIQLTCQVEDDLPEVYIDRTRVLQVIGNLVSNALKFTGAGGKVRVEAARQDNGDWVQVSVTDDGVGIPEEHLSRIFDRLYQVKEPLSAGKGGLGIGLSLCRQLVQQQGGEIWVESRPGEGSRFHFTLPRWNRSHAEENNVLEEMRS